MRKFDPRLLGDALRHLGVRLNVEQDAELQGLVSAAFVRLTQEAAAKRCFPAMEQALELVSGVEGQRPGIARALRGKMGIEDRVPEFVEEALRARQAAAGLTGVLKLLPQTAMEQLALRFNRCALREDVENVANLASDLGEEGVQCLRSTLRGGQVAEAVEAIGLLSKLDLQSLAIFLPSRIKDFPPASQDRAIRQISSAAAPGRCRVLLELIDHLNPLVMPLAIDEIGVTSDREALPRLLTVADGDLPPGGAPYLRVKAVEALGRIQAPESTAALKRIVEARKMFGWAEPQELRIAAIQALEKLDPAWAIAFLPKSGLDKDDLALAPLDLVPNCKFVRQRRHGRVRLNKPVTAISTNLKEACRLEIRTASLDRRRRNHQPPPDSRHSGPAPPPTRPPQRHGHRHDARLSRPGYGLRNRGHHPRRAHQAPPPPVRQPLLDFAPSFPPTPQPRTPHPWFQPHAASPASVFTSATHAPTAVAFLGATASNQLE